MAGFALTEPFSWAAEPVKGSRFEAVLVPVADEAAALAAVRAAEARFPSADHVCWAWRLSSGGTRVWDGAEPRGSAGRPILQQLEGHEVEDVVAIVARWFGGTKLGVGGLMRAYGGTAGMALDRAPLAPRVDHATFAVVHGYADTGALDSVLTAHGAEVMSAAWELDVRRVIRVTADREQALRDAIVERTAGRATLEDG